MRVYLYACVSVRLCATVGTGRCGAGGVFQSRFRSRGRGGRQHRHPHRHPLTGPALAPAGTLIGRASGAGSARAQGERRCVSRPASPPSTARPEGTRPALPGVCPRSCPRSFPRPRGPGGALRRRVPALTAPPMPARRCRGRGPAGPARTGRAAPPPLPGRASPAPQGEEQECGNEAKGAPRCELTPSLSAGRCGCAPVGERGPQGGRAEVGGWHLLLLPL